MDIWLFLLVLAAIFIGWLLGQWQPFHKKSARQTDIFSEKYAKGLNYLLADDSDNAIKIFTDLTEVNKDTIDIHITLANLYRSKGEVDRAIKIHQNLLARPNLTRRQRHMAIAELAGDYLKAGLLDRAEKLYREMIELDADPQQAYRRLLELYITEKSWEDAEECAQVLYKMGEPEAGIAYSQCLCEIASNAIDSGNNRLARKSLDRALEVDTGSVRATLILIRLHLQTDNRATAEGLFLRLTRQSPEYMALFIEPARQIFHNDESQVYREFLQDQYQQHPSTQLAIALLEHYTHDDEIDKARHFLFDILNKSPSFEAFEFALRFLKSNPDRLGEAGKPCRRF